MTKIKKRKLKSLFIRNKGLSEYKYKPEGTRLVYKENEVMENRTLIEENKSKLFFSFDLERKKKDDE